MRILVFDKVYVPGYGMGPFITPIEVTDPRTLATLKRQSRIKVIEDHKTKVAPKAKFNEFPIRIRTAPTEEVVDALKTATEEVVETPVETVVEEEVVETVVEEEVVETVVEEEVVETVVEEEVVDYSELTIHELKAILDEMGVAYLYKDTKTSLIEKILENK